ncbi:hypothetical protein [Streptomyces sp. NPDC101776]|uniref:hypothetical protein n=1 Tax=Streptomyces sp. NPDC101776 TaxID=3366146 RepID=UPI003816CA93
MTDVLTWTVERRVELAERAELLRKELAGIDAEVARLEAAEVVIGPGAGGMRLVPDRTEGMGAEVLTPEYQRIMAIVAGAGGPVMAKDVAIALGRETTPGKVEPVRGQLRKLSDRGWLARTGSGRYLPS